MYQDTPFNPAPYALSIGDMIAHSADAQAHAAAVIGAANARAAELKGAVWGNAAQNIGQIPNQIIAAQGAETDRRLKQEALEQSIGDRKENARVKAVLDVGRSAAMSNDPESFIAAVQEHVKVGTLPPEVGAHIVSQVQAAGPDGWREKRNQYIGFADSYQQAVKLGVGDILARPSVDPNKPATVVASGPPKMSPVGPNQTLVAEGTTPTGQPSATPVMTAPGTPGQGDYTINGQRFHATGEPVGAPVPLQEKPGEAEERAARIDQIKKQSAEIDAKLAGTMPLSPKDRAELEIQREHLSLSRIQEEMRARREDVNSPQNQEKLEQAYRSLAQTVIRSRSGQLGVEDQKVGAAKHVMTLLEQAKNPDGTYDLARIQRRELATGLAKLISPTGNISEQQVEELDQRTAKGAIADLVTYVTGDPKLVNATPQKVAELFRDSIVRQGKQAEQNREKELDFIRSSRPTDLDPKRAEGIEKGLAGLNRISDVLPGGRDSAAPAPAPVRGVLDGKPAGTYTLTDGSVWTVDKWGGMTPVKK